MKRICNSLISLTLVFAMLLSFGIFVFADEPEATDDLIYTNVESKYLKYTLQEYVNSGAESAVFYSQRCILSSEKADIVISDIIKKHLLFIYCVLKNQIPLTNGAINMI